MVYFLSVFMLHYGVVINIVHNYTLVIKDVFCVGKHTGEDAAEE